MTQSSLVPGHRIGPYRILEPLGAGGMAQVYVAQRDGAAQVCVLKLLHVELETRGEAAQRFQREAHIASQLDHPCIAPVLDAGWADDRFFIAMPLIIGVTVEQLLEQAKARGGVLPFEVSVPIALQALEALEYAHQFSGPDGQALGLVHRDLSPRNIMLGFDGRVQIIDFGVAKGQVDELQTASGVLMGTPFYMSPEQAHARRVDHRSDLYTLAAVLFEMLTGWRLARGKGRIQIMLSVTNDPAPRASRLNMHAPAALDEVLLKALAKKPEERFESAAALATAIREQAGELAIVSEARSARFVQALLPEEHEAARARALSVAPSPLSAPGGSDSLTRTAPVKTKGAVAPLPLDPAELEHMPTRTALAAGRERPDVATTAAAPKRRLGRWGAAALGLLAGLAAALGYVARTSFEARPLPLEPPRPSAASPSARPAAPEPPDVRPVALRAAPNRPPEPEPEPEPATGRRAEPPLPKPASPAPRAPTPALEAARPPPPKPAERLHSDLARRIEALRSSRDRQAALSLAKAIHQRARALTPAHAARVHSEVERVYLTANVDTMIEALADALAALRGP